MSQFLDPRFAGLVSYVPGEQPQQTGRLIKLNTNESPFAPAPGVAAAVAAETARLQLYCDPTARQVVQPLAAALGLPPAQVLCGNGSDELLAFCFFALCPAGAAFADITYGFYPVYSRVFGVDAVTIPLAQDFTLRGEDYTALHRTIFIANPNAPTGLALSRAQIEGILRANPDSLVVVDEAYVDFCAESTVPLLARYENLLVIGTFSKSRQLAGGRLGYAAGSAAVIADLTRIKNSFNPYNVNRMTQAAAAASLADTAYFAACRDKIIATRTRTLSALAQMGFLCTDSRANFVFASHPGLPAGEMAERLRERDILVRWWDLPRIENHLRITIGADDEMDTLFEALRELLRTG